MPPSRILQPFVIDVESQPGNTEPVTFCANKLANAGLAPAATMRPHLRELLSWSSRVPDTWRYCFTVEHGRVSGNWELASGSRKLTLSEFPDDVDMTDYLGGLNIILLVLESPHVAEYVMHCTQTRLVPKGPAQGRKPGDAGGAIERYGLQVLDLLAQKLAQQTCKPLPDGKYALVLANPVPYLTSLHWMDVLTGHAAAPSGNLRRPVRNHVWKQLWSLQTVQDDFIRRCRQYAPKAILNCCTSDLKDAVTCSLCDAGFGSMTYCAFHPAYNWKKGISNAKRPVRVTPANCIACPVVATR